MLHITDCHGLSRSAAAQVAAGAPILKVDLPKGLPFVAGKGEVIGLAGLWFAAAIALVLSGMAFLLARAEAG